MAHMHDLCKTLSSQDGAGLKHDGPMREGASGRYSCTLSASEQ
jgi:hypothetical protein